MEIITSQNNSRVVLYSKLNDKKYREENQMFLLENYKLTLEAIDRHEDIVSILIREDMTKKYHDIVSSQNEKVMVLSKNVFSKISDTVTSQGIIAVLKIKAPKAVESIQGKTLVLDRIQDAGNMGTLMRSAIGFGFENVVLIDCVDPYNPKVVRSCGGSVFSLNLFKNTEKNVISHAKNNNFAVFVADMDGENLYSRQEFERNTMVIVGNEGQGVSQFLKANATNIVMIPMTENLESLNAGVSGSIIMSYINSKSV